MFWSVTSCWIYLQVPAFHAAFCHQYCSWFKPQLKGYKEHLKSLILYQIDPLQNCHRLDFVEKNITKQDNKTAELYCTYDRAELWKIIHMIRVKQTERFCPTLWYRPRRDFWGNDSMDIHFSICSTNHTTGSQCNMCMAVIEWYWCEVNIVID